jgi:hypothetical protein
MNEDYKTYYAQLQVVEKTLNTVIYNMSSAELLDYYDKFFTEFKKLTMLRKLYELNNVSR